MNLVPVNRNRYFQGVLLTREAKLKTNGSVTWTTDKQEQPQMAAIITNATLWCHEVGEFLLKQGNALRCQVDPAHKRTLSLFQLGLRWLKRTLAIDLLVLPDFTATLSNLKLVRKIQMCKGIRQNHPVSGKVYCNSPEVYD